jgi:O-antigen ligase
MLLMKIWTKAIPKFLNTRGGRVLLFFLAIPLSGIAGGLAPWLTRYFAGREMLILFTLLGFWPFLLLCTLKFDFMVLVTFCSFSLVRIEPAPVDALSMALLLLGLLTGNLSQKTLTGSSVIHLALWFFVVMNFVSLLATPAFFDSLRYVVITFYLIAFAYFVRMYIISFRTMRNVIVGYLVSVMIAVFLVALGYLGVGPSEVFLEDNRAMALFKDANTFGPFLILMIILLIDEIWHPCIFPGFHPLKIFGIVILSAAVFLSFSRGAWGNLMLSLFVYFILNRKEISLKRAVGLLLLAVVALLALLTVIEKLGLLEFLRWRASPFQSYDSVRFARQAAGIEAGLTHPFGIGPAMLFHAHSLYVRTFAEYGILGFVSYFSCVFILFIRTFLHALQETGKPSGLSAKVLFACFAGVLLNSFVIDTLHWRHFWLIFALSWVVVSMTEHPAPSDHHVLGFRSRGAVQEG